MRLIRVALGFAALVFGVQIAIAQDDNSLVKIATLKMGPLPVLPACATIAPTHGDPFNGAATIAIKMTMGCKIPWHWHTAGESLIIVTGKGKIEMKDNNMAETMGPGDTVYLPGKHHHQFTCLAACTFYDVTEAAFDIHYVDKDGNGIKPEDAVKNSAAKPSAHKADAKK